MQYEELSPENLTSHLEKRKRELEIILNQKTNQLKKTPKGRLYLSSSNHNPQFYISADQNYTKSETALAKNKKAYIKKKNIPLIKIFAQKEYDNQLSNTIHTELEKINTLLFQLKTSSIESVYSNIHVEKKSYIKPVTFPNDDYIKKWNSVKFISRGFDDNSKKFITSSGLQVRSKSEVLIAEVLIRMKIPFRYEFPINLKKITVYPDFYCLNVKMRKEIAWEHFGMLDDPEYSNSASIKLNTYMDADFFPGDKLIITTETKENPLSLKNIEKIITKYLL